MCVIDAQNFIQNKKRSWCKMSKAKELLQNTVVKARNQQKAGGFIDLPKQSIRLFGKSLNELVQTDKSKVHEVVMIEDENLVVHYDGESVTAADVFSSSQDLSWNGDDIRFMLNDIALSANQYDYIKTHGSLPKYSFFARTNDGDTEVKHIWRIVRKKSNDNRMDSGKETLYLTIGSITWTQNDGNTTKLSKSPLLLCQIKATNNSKDCPRFTISSDKVKLNALLVRELKANGIDLFNDLTIESIPFGTQIFDYIDNVKNNADSYNVKVDADDFDICILDSTNESICQYIERNMDNLVEAPLIKVLAGDMKYDELEHTSIAPFAVYPLLADDSQREVIKMVLNGHSLNVSAAAGTGKSQTMGNIVANFAINGKKALVMSEKKAANEVLVKYLSKIGLDKVCLILDNNMTLAQLIDQLVKIKSIERVYVDSIKGRDLLSDIAEVENYINHYNNALFKGIAACDMRLYDLIGDCIQYRKVDDTSMLNVEISKYRMVCRKLNELQSTIDTLISEETFQSYVESGTTGDEDMDYILNNNLSEIASCGVDIISFAVTNKISVKDIVVAAKANIARLISTEIIKQENIADCGNMQLRLKYTKLTEDYAKLRSLYVAYINQEISKLIVSAIKEDEILFPNLDRINTSRMTLTDFFKNYGKALVKVCPIVITTPSVAVNYITNDMNTFDALLIDEASQVPIISVLPFLIGNRSLVAFGDNMQLDITSFFLRDNETGYNDNGEFDIRLTDKSILHLVQGKGIPSARLEYHYRSKTSTLMTVSNLFCYNSALNVAPDVYNGISNLPSHLGFELIKVDIPFDAEEARASVTPKKDAKSKQRNSYIENYEKLVTEQMVTEIVQKVIAIKEDTPKKSIGIVTLNDDFQKKLDLEIDDSIMNGHITWDRDNDDETIWVRSLENAQGKEADIIIIAISHAKRTIGGILKKNISGFFNGGPKTEQSGYNRLNVLFTRAREKNIIFISFDYKEIRDTEGSLQRLYTYLEYADTGRMSCAPIVSPMEDATNAVAAKVVSEALNGRKVCTQVGSNLMQVDLAVMQADSDKRYDIGILMPYKKISNNTMVTKINMLERNGWKLLPISVTYLLKGVEQFKKQLPIMLEKNRALGSNLNENFIVNAKPVAPITLREISLRKNINEIDEIKENIGLINKLTIEEFASIDLEKICRKACDDNIANASDEKINSLYKTNHQAFLVKLAQNIHKYALLNDNAKLDVLKAKTDTLYRNLGERRACYLLAQLIRCVDDISDEATQSLVRSLLNEAIAMEIITNEEV